MRPLSIRMFCLQEVSHNASLCFTCMFRVVIVLCLTASTRGLSMAQAHNTVGIFPAEPTIHVGGNITLTCTIRQSSSLHAKDLKWRRDGVALPSELYTALSDKTSQLVLQDAQFQDSGLYACVAEKSSLDEGNETQVYVGVPPSQAEDVSCFCRNYFDVTCTWGLSGATNINTTHTLQYHIIHENSSWINCSKDKCICKDMQTCTLHGTVHWPARFRVMSSNSLGRAISEDVYFDHEQQTVPFPPRNIAARAIPRTRLNVTWDLPAEWKSHFSEFLHYKLEYHVEGSAVQMEYSITIAESPGRRYFELPSPDKLDAYTTYCVRAAARLAGDLWSDWSGPVCQRTLEEKPDAKVNATWSSKRNAESDSLRDVVLQWEPLSKPHARGIILEYRVFNATVPHKDYELVAAVGSSNTSLTLPGVERYKEYRFALEASNSIGASPRTFLDITAEVRPTTPVAVAIAATLLGILVILGLVTVGVYCIKHSGLLKPVPSISFIALDKFERVLSRPIQRGMVEREVFDEPLGHRTPNGVIPGAPDTHSNDTAARMMEDGEEDYVVLREGSHNDEGLPLLQSSAALDNSRRKSSQASTDSAHSSGTASEKELYSPESTGGCYGKFAKLYVELPAVQGLAQSGLIQPRLDSTDSGFGENCAEYRMPTYAKMSAIPADPGAVEAPPSGNGDTNSVDSGSDVYHRLAAAEPAGSVDQSDPSAYMNPSVPSYTRLSSIPNVLFSGIAPSVGESGLILDSNGNLPNGTVPSIGRPGTGNS